VDLGAQEINNMKKQDAFMKKLCNVGQAVEVAKAAAADAVEDYHKQNFGLLASISVNIELLKSILFANNLITEEQYSEKFEESMGAYIENINKVVKEYTDNLKVKLAATEDPKVNIKTESRGN